MKSLFFGLLLSFTLPLFAQTEEWSIDYLPPKFQIYVSPFELLNPFTPSFAGGLEVRVNPTQSWVLEGGLISTKLFQFYRETATAGYGFKLRTGYRWYKIKTNRTGKHLIFQGVKVGWNQAYLPRTRELCRAECRGGFNNATLETINYETNHSTFYGHYHLGDIYYPTQRISLSTDFGLGIRVTYQHDEGLLPDHRDPPFYTPPLFRRPTNRNAVLYLPSFYANFKIGYNF